MQVSPLIQVEELSSHLSDANWKVIDVRYDLADPQYGQNSYQTARIPGALWLDLEEDLCAERTGYNGRHPLASQDVLIEKLQNLGINNDDHIVFYDDQNSMLACHAWWILRYLGHESVQVLDGGYKAWVDAGLPLETDNPQAINEQGDIELKESDFEVVFLAEILDHILGNRQEGLQLVDARGTARFEGKEEPLDPVAGHIPTAINYPFAQNLTERGTFKDPATLKSEWLAFLDGIEPATIVHQCGSGVSACHNLFALYYAGLGISRLYHGSWSEWCSDHNRPIVTGPEGNEVPY